MERDIQAIESRLLIAFDALMIELSVTRAAARIGMTQQGLSGQLAKMRRLFGDPLFVRDGAGIAATPQAEELHPKVQSALAGLRLLVTAQKFDPLQLNQVITLAATDYAIALLLPPLLKKLHAVAPRLKLAVRPVNSATLAADMRERLVDMALTVPQFTPPGLKTQRLFDEIYVGVVRQRHPLAKGKVTLDRFCAYQHILVSPNRGDFHGPTDEALSKAGRKRDIAVVLPSFSVVTAMLEATDLIAVLPQKLVQQSRRKLFSFPVPVPVKGFALHATWPDRLDADEQNRWFRKMVSAALPE